VTTRAGADTLADGVTVYRDGDEVPLVVASFRTHQQRVLLTFVGYESRDAAQTLVGATIFALRSEVPLGQSEFFDRDLVGLALRDRVGRELGTVVAVEHYPGSDMLIVGPKRKMVPLVRQFVRNVDLERREITVELPPGLLDDAAAEEA
jgi:16S rRNA processing protein RimM